MVPGVRVSTYFLGTTVQPIMMTLCSPLHHSFWAMYLALAHKRTINLTQKRCEEHVSTEAHPPGAWPPLWEEAWHNLLEDKRNKRQGRPRCHRSPSCAQPRLKLNPVTCMKPGEVTELPRQVTK